MKKKIILIFIILLLSIYLFGCGEKTLPTTTTTTTTTTTLVYNLSSLNGNVLAMDYMNGNFYVLTDTRLYKIDKSDPTNLSTYVAPTHDYKSISRDSYDGTSYDSISCFDPNVIFTYDESLNIRGSWNASDFNLQDTGEAVTSPAFFSYIGYDNNYFFKSHWDLGSNSMVTDNIYSVAASGIISLSCYGTSPTSFYACSSSTIYKYNSTFTTVESATLPGASTLVGIAFDGTYIWVIDSNKKLYKIIDDL